MTDSTIRLWGVALVLTVAWASPVVAQMPVSEPVALRLRADSGLVGHFQFQSEETHRLKYDVPADDPRAPLLAKISGPWRRNTRVALTLISPGHEPDADRAYRALFLGYRLTGGEVRSLRPVQWDSIFDEVGRGARVHLSPRGDLRRVEVPSEIVRPVGDALAGVLTTLPLTLPRDPVQEGDQWSGQVSVPVRRPDGTRVLVAVQLSYLLRRLIVEEGTRIAHFEFRGQPIGPVAGAESVFGEYSGTAAFDVNGGRFDAVRAEAQLEVRWQDSGELPPSRSVLNWDGRLDRSKPDRTEGG